MSRLSYTILLEPDPDEGGYTVTVPELPGVVTEGATYHEAIEMAHEAITLHIEGLRADGLPVPVERAAPTLASIEVEASNVVLANI